MLDRRTGNREQRTAPKGPNMGGRTRTPSLGPEILPPPIPPNEPQTETPAPRSVGVRNEADARPFPPWYLRYSPSRFSRMVGPRRGGESAEWPAHFPRVRRGRLPLAVTSTRHGTARHECASDEAAAGARHAAASSLAPHRRGPFRPHLRPRPPTPRPPESGRPAFSPVAAGRDSATPRPFTTGQGAPSAPSPEV